MSPDTISTESYAKVGSNSKVKDPTTGVTGGGPLPATTLKFDAVNWMSYVIGADFAGVLQCHQRLRQGVDGALGVVFGQGLGALLHLIPG